MIEAERRWLGKADLAIVGDPMASVVAAAALRRAGLSVETFLSGSEKKNRSRAMGLARRTVSVEEVHFRATDDWMNVFDEPSE